MIELKLYLLLIKYIIFNELGYSLFFRDLVLYVLSLCYTFDHLC